MKPERPHPRPLTLGLTFGLALGLALTGGCASTATGDLSMNASSATAFDPSPHTAPATALLRRYESALNAAGVDAIAALYADDAVFMAQHRRPAVGKPAIEAAYREILGMIRLDIRFEIDELVVVSPTVAWARTRSAGTMTILANGAKVAEGNQELFVLTRADASAEWRIGRYIFSTTQPRG